MVAVPADGAGDSTGWDGIDVAPLVQLAQNQLEGILRLMPDSKTLFIDPTLAGPLGLMADLAALRQRGVERMFWMEETPASVTAVHIHASTKHLLYLCRPDTRWLRTILAHYTADKAEGDLQHEYTVAFVPHRTEPCVQFLRTHITVSIRSSYLIWDSSSRCCRKTF